MLTTARVELPVSIAARLGEASNFVDNVNDYAREDLIGFRRPVAAAFALVAPVAFALAFLSTGLVGLLQISVTLIVFETAALVYVGISEWPRIVADFQTGAEVKKMAVADLRCGFGESSFLSNGRSPRFFEYEYGVLILADAGDLKTLFFCVSNDGSDPRWELYQSGELNRGVWRWLRLPVSREVVKFSTEGTKLAREPETPFVDSIGKLGSDQFSAWRAFGRGHHSPTI